MKNEIISPKPVVFRRLVSIKSNLVFLEGYQEVILSFYIKGSFNKMEAVDLIGMPVKAGIYGNFCVGVVGLNEQEQKKHDDKLQKCSAVEKDSASVAEFG